MDGIITGKWANCCRLCLFDDGIKLPIFEAEGLQRQVARKIQTCFPILIYSGDPLPKMICHKCLYKLDTVYEFRQKCLEANVTLKNELFSMRHVPEVKHYLSKLGKQVGKIPLETRIEGLSHLHAMDKNPVIRRKDGGANSTDIQGKGVAGNMFQGIFIADCSSEVFLPENGGDTSRPPDGAEVSLQDRRPLDISSLVNKLELRSMRQRPVPSSSSRSSGSEVTSSQTVKTSVSNMSSVPNVPASNQSSKSNNDQKSVPVTVSSDVGMVSIKQEPPDEDYKLSAPSLQTKEIPQNTQPAMTTSMKTSWSSISSPPLLPPPPPPPPMSVSSSNIPYPVTSLSIKSLMSLKPPAPQHSQIPNQSLPPQMCQPPLKSHVTHPVPQPSVIHHILHPCLHNLHLQCQLSHQNIELHHQNLRLYHQNLK
ncbi:hypothetical protein L9F63_020825 [Diploptera punctata]|uniref:ZAD domain-containing protein n=1 Tax=Diploptera punctata TaxID=6984 RepID=A0AAD7ZS47_DIPPU|nr:hypothetical protein L9F63_020825 [Diploptera punctata]